MFMIATWRKTRHTYHILPLGDPWQALSVKLTTQVSLAESLNVSVIIAPFNVDKGSALLNLIWLNYVVGVLPAPILAISSDVVLVADVGTRSFNAIFYKHYFRIIARILWVTTQRESIQDVVSIHFKFYAMCLNKWLYMVALTRTSLLLHHIYILF